MKALLNIFLLSLTLLCSPIAAMDSSQQMQVPTIQQQIQIRDATECEQRVMYYHEQLVQHPNSPYFKFMYNLWFKRCPDK